MDNTLKVSQCYEYEVHFFIEFILVVPNIYIHKLTDIYIYILIGLLIFCSMVTVLVFNKILKIKRAFLVKKIQVVKYAYDFYWDNQ